MSKRSLRFAWIAFAICVVFTLSSFGQDITGSIVGTVKDSNGAAIAGATVTAIIPSQGNRVIRTVTTNDDGAFSIPNVPVNVYSVTVEAVNFKKFVQTELKVDVGQRRPVDVVLEAGNIQEIVTVEADAIAVESTTPQNATNITSTQLSELSINNRNWVQFITLAPGVSNNLADLVPVGNFSPDGSPNIMSISVNGARQSQNTYTVDGADITDRGANITIQASPSLDSIGELKILRSLYPAESGRSGGGQINVVTKSGTDDIHGTFFEFVRNEVFNANTFFINRNPASPKDENGKAIRPPFRYNNYGFTVGGPVYFLNFGEDEGLFQRVPKTYFFFSEEQRKDRRYLTLNGQVPTANMRQGIFTNPICVSASQTAAGVRTCNQILPAGSPLSSMATYNPASAQYLQYVYNRMPLPSGTGTALTSLGVARFDFRQEVIKFDTSITKDWTAYYRYQRDTVPTLNPQSVNNTFCNVADVCPIETDAPGRTHTFQTTYVISPSLIVEGRYVRAYGGIFTTPQGLLALENSPIQVAKPYPIEDPRIPWHTGFTTLSNVQGFGAWNNFSVKNDWGGSITWIASGKHTMKFGGNYSTHRKNEDQLGGNPQGTFSSFANTVLSSPARATVCVNTSNAAIACPTGVQTTEQQFANMLLGFNMTFSQTKYNLTADFRQQNFEWYAEDEFRVSPRLTMYLGVRYSYFGPPWDKNGLLSNFVPELYESARAPQITFNGTTSNRVSGSGNFCNGLIVNAQNYQTGPSVYECTPSASPYGKYVYKSEKNNYAPRLGIAWDVTGKGKTVLRTGYGIYHDQVLLGNVELHLGNPPYQETITISGGSMSQPVPTGQTPSVVASVAVPAIIRAVPTDYKTPYMQHWSFDLQHLLFPKTFVQIGYYGSKGTHLIGVVDINNLPAGYALTQTCQLTSSTTGPCQRVQAGTGLPEAFGTAYGQGQLDQIRPYRGYRSIYMVKPIFNSNYHSLQVQATQRFTGASQIQLAYTWSKNLTDNQTDRSTAPQNVYNIPIEYGRAQLDRRHILTVNYIYELPWFKDQQGFVGKVLGGWQFSGIATYQTGLPFTPTVGAGTWDPAGLGYFGSSPAGGRPNATCDPNEGAPHTFDQWFNTQCFAFPQFGPAVPGTSSRGMIDGPPTARFDLTLTKNIRWGERYKLQLKGEAFNVFNHTNFTTMGLAATTPSTFGVISATRDPRTIQLGIKFSY